MLNKCKLGNLKDCKLANLKDCKVVKKVALGVVAVTSCLGVVAVVWKKLKRK